MNSHHHGIAWIIIIIFIFSFSIPAGARTYIVSQASAAASDTNPGSEVQPLKTIQAGADRAEPGDIILVHAGTYREWVKPPRGGVSEQKRITYKAAPGEKVFIKGSDRIARWQKVKQLPGDQNRGRNSDAGPNTEKAFPGLWMATIENAYFEDYNPYDLTINGEWLDYGDWNHRGDVYFNNKAYGEKQTVEEVAQTPESWFTKVDSGTTKIWANFGPVNPDSGLVEINVRHTVFFPEKRGLKYITVDGFILMHSAENWGPPGTRNGDGQWGVIGPRWGYSWIIENCTVINAKCIGITLGVVPGTRNREWGTWGHHIVRNNHVLRCGQAGIAGDAGNVGSLIENNLIEWTNDRMQFGGTEGAGIKFHFAVDVTIKGNIVRGVYDKMGHGGYGIWLDFGCQNTRVSGNIFYDTKKSCMFLEAFHGPILVDNNLFIGNSIMAHAESQVFVHNLFYNSSVTWAIDGRRTPIYAPHSFKHVKSETPTPRDDRWLNNIFIGGGLSAAPEAPDFRMDNNVFLNGAKKSRYDAHSVIDTGKYDAKIYADSNLIAFDFGIGQSVVAMKCPAINTKMLDSFPVTGMMIEDRFGKPIEINRDFYGKPMKAGSILPGPFQSIIKGDNSFSIWSKVQGVSRLYRISVKPSDCLTQPGAAQQFSATAHDQFGKVITPASGFSWETAGGGSINNSGLFTAGTQEGGPWQIKAKAATVTGSSNIWISSQTPGLSYAYYEGSWKAVPDFASLYPVKTGIVKNFDITVAARPDSFGIRFDGRINIPATGTYTFYLNSDDGSRLFIDGALIVDNGSGHAIKEDSSSVDLKTGMHSIVITYFESAVQEWLSLEWQGPGFTRQSVPDEVLFIPSKK